MTRQSAYQLLTKYIKNPILLKHALAVEVTMRAFASYFGEDEDVWGITGLLHDTDYEISRNKPGKHGKLLFEKEPNVIPAEIERAIKAHNFEWTNIMPQTRMEWTLVCCDDLTGFIMKTASLYESKRVENVTIDFLLKNLRKGSVFPGADRRKILYCQSKLGIPVTQFITTTLHAMVTIGKILDEPILDEKKKKK